MSIPGEMSGSARASLNASLHESQLVAAATNLLAPCSGAGLVSDLGLVALGGAIYLSDRLATARLLSGRITLQNNALQDSGDGNFLELEDSNELQDGGWQAEIQALDACVEMLNDNLKTYLNKRAKFIVKAFLDDKPEPKINNTENQNLLTKELKLLCKYIIRAENRGVVTVSVQKLIETRLLDFQSSMEAIEKNVRENDLQIKETFFPGRADSYYISLSKIVQAAGETHKGGTKPSFLAFSVVEIGKGESDELKIVYKPRSIEVDRLICGVDDSLFSLMNEPEKNTSSSSSSSSSQKSFDSESSQKSFDSDGLFPTFRQLSMSGYGYAEFLSHEEADYQLTNSQMDKYYETIGAIQAIAQIFGISDLNQENVLVHLHRPYLIDLEVAFNLRNLILTQETELSMAVRAFGDPSKGRPTNNQVVLIDDNKEVIEMKMHYETHRANYFKHIQIGFEQVKGLIVAKKARLLHFVDRLAARPQAELPLRHVFVGTGDLMSLQGQNEPGTWNARLCARILYELLNEQTRRYCDLDGAPEEIAKCTDELMMRLVQISARYPSTKEFIAGLQELAFKPNFEELFGLTLEEFRPVIDFITSLRTGLSDALQESVDHHDVPFFQTNVQGDLYLGGFLLGKAKESIVNLIKQNIQEAHNLAITESFKEGIFA